MTVFSNFTNEQLIKEFNYYWQKDYKPKGLFEEVSKRLLELEKKDELLELYKEYFQIVERGDNDWHYRMNEIPQQVKALEEEMK